MDEKNKSDLEIQFSKGTPESNSVVAPSSPNNPVDQAADFLPRALVCIREYFKEAIFLMFILSYSFIAALGHMERIRNYLGYFSLFIISIIVYYLWNKVSVKDILYLIIILLLIMIIILNKFNIIIV